MNIVEVENSICVPFQWKDRTPGGKNLGRAEFQVCIRFKDGEVDEFWVYPRQQHNMTEYWHRSAPNDKFFAFRAFEGLKEPWVWMVSWCDEHEAQAMSFYVPDDAKYLRIDFYGIGFTKTKW